MPSIKDYHITPFSELSDWFGFAVVACQLFIGIHPFKGSHPDFKKRDMENRMRKNISIFNQDTECPPTVRDFSLIPSKYRDWFIDLFENGKRSFPPTELGNMIAAAKKTLIIKSTEQFLIKLLSESKEKILYHQNILGKSIIKTPSKILIDNKEYDIGINTECIITERDLIPILIKIKDGYIIAKNTATDETTHFNNILATDFMIVNNMLFVINKGNVSNVVFREFDKKIVVSIGKTWKIMPLSSTVFSNVIYQSILGKPFLFIPVNTKLSLSVAVPELDGCKIVNMGHQNGVIVAITHKNNKYSRIVLKFDKNYVKYDYRIKETDFTDINFVVLDNGIVILISDEQEMEIFSKNIGHTKVKEIKNKTIRTDMKLCCDGTQARFFQDNKIYTIQTK